MTPFHTALVRCEVGAAVAAAVVWTLTRTLGRRLPPRWRYALWLVVLGRLCLPTLPGVPIPLPLPLPTARPPAATPKPPRPQPFAVEPVTPAEPIPVDRLPDPPAAVPAMVAPAPSPRPPTDPALWLLRACVAVAAVLLARLAVQTVRLHARIRSYPPVADDRLLADVSAASRSAGRPRPPPAVVSPAGTGPAVAGLFRPRLLLPADFAAALPPAARRLVLIHELAHVRRRDVPVGWAASAVAAVHWFNPAAWLALRELRVERELATDAAVLDATGDRAGYGDTLVRLVRRTRPHTPAAAPGMADPTARTLERRLTMIARHYPATGRRTATTSVGVLAVVAAASTLWAVGPGVPPATGPSPRPVTRPAVLSATVPATGAFSGYSTYSGYVADRQRGADAARAALGEMWSLYRPRHGEKVWLVRPPFAAPRDRFAAAEVLADGWPLRPLPPTTWRWSADGRLELAGYIGDTSNVALWDRLSLGVPWYKLGDTGGVGWTPGDNDVVYRADATEEERVAGVATLVAADTGRAAYVTERTLPRPWLVVGGQTTVPDLPFGPGKPANDAERAVVITARVVTRADLAAWAARLRVSTGNYPEFTRPFGWDGVGYHLHAPLFDADTGPTGTLRPALASAVLLLDKDLMWPRTPITDDQRRQVLANLRLQVAGDWRIEDRPTLVYSIAQSPPPATRP